jgi:hypothetical protein
VHAAEPEEGLGQPIVVTADDAPRRERVWDHQALPAAGEGQWRVPQRAQPLVSPPLPPLPLCPTLRECMLELAAAWSGRLVG